MIQAVIKSGVVFSEQVPAPIVSKGCILIKVYNSCISSGTESATIKVTGDSLIKRALKQPDNVRKVFDMARLEGIGKTYGKMKTKLSVGKPTGYSISGIVVGIGEGVFGFSIGDRVAAGGSGVANHAEYVDVPQNLVVKIPFELNFIKASTVTLGAIALQGVRRASSNLGEFVVVFGSGILGLLALQLLKASGVRVAAIDLDPERLSIAEKLGAEIIVNPVVEDPLQKVNEWSNGYGADAVIFAAATNDSKPLSTAFNMCKRKGRVILLGVSGMNIKREDIYPKELDFLISTSYGPGRYDSKYEEKGLDYPYSYVRWTENRNMHEYLRLLNEGLVNIDLLITKVFSIQNLSVAFELIQENDKKPLMVVLSYSDENKKKLKTKILCNQNKTNKKLINVAIVGAGNFAIGVHMPNLIRLKEKFNIHAVMNRTGLKGKQVADLYKASYATTNYDEILDDPKIDLILIATRHDSHAELTLKGLAAGKNVFVEKPLAVDEKQYEEIADFFSLKEKPPLLMVGFNRRFSRYAREIKKQVDKAVNPLFLHYRMNAGYLPIDHWVHENGGRIVGEACHIVDLMSFFIGSRIQSISCEEISPKTEHFSNTDNKSIVLKYENGSVATIEYFSMGNSSLSKEYMEVHFDHKTIVLDDYKSLKGYGVKLNEISSKVSRKGQFEEMNILYDSLTIENASWPIELWDMLQTTRACMLI